MNHWKVIGGSLILLSVVLVIVFHDQVVPAVYVAWTVGWAVMLYVVDLSQAAQQTVERAVGGPRFSGRCMGAADIRQ